MRILVVNSGSSSIKFSMFDSNARDHLSEPGCLFNGQVTNIGEVDARLEFQGAEGTKLSGTRTGVVVATPEEAMRLVLDTVCEPQMPAVQAAGYRVVHPGAKLHEHQRITEEVLRDLEEAVVPSSAIETMQLGGLAGLTALTMGIGQDRAVKEKEGLLVTSNGSKLVPVGESLQIPLVPEAA